MSTPVITPQQPSQALPSRLRAGDALNFQMQTQLAVGINVFLVLSAIVNNAPVRQFLGYTPAAGATPASYTVAVDQNGVATFAIPSATTDTWAAGRYDWQAFSWDGTSRNPIASGVIRILPDVAGTVAVDQRTYNEKLLGQIRSLLLGKSLDDVAIYKIGGRELTKIPTKDLLEWEGVIEGRVRRERINRGDYVPSKTKGINFGRGGCGWTS